MSIREMFRRKADKFKPMSSSEAFELAYARQPNTNEKRFLDQIRPTTNSLGTLRAVIARFDRQTYPTSITVRFGQDDIVIENIGSFKLVLDKYDASVSAPILSGVSYEAHVRAFVEAHLKPGMSAIDIGANVGFYTLLFAATVGAKGKVFAFEPNTENCRLILLSIAENQVDNVSLFPVALTNRTGLVFFSPAIGSNGGLIPSTSQTLLNPNCTIVQAVVLDDMVKEPIHLIKADVEGAEFLALSGARALIEEYRPLIVTEFSMEMMQRVSGISGANFLKWMVQQSYQPNILDKLSSTTVPIDDIDAFINGWGDPGRIEDLAFVPIHP